MRRRRGKDSVWRRYSGRCPPLVSGLGEGPGLEGLSLGLLRKSPRAATPWRVPTRGSRGESSAPPGDTGRGARRLSSGHPRPRGPAAAAAAATAVAARGGGGRRRRHCYSGTKTRGAGTPGANERDPPPAAPCWKRAAAPGRTHPRRWELRKRRAACGAWRVGERLVLLAPETLLTRARGDQVTALSFPDPA